MKDDNKNIYLAIALSILVIIGWNYFYGWPQMQKQREAQRLAQTPATQTTPSSAAGNGTAAPLPGAASPPQGAASQPSAGAPPETTQTRAAAIAASPRVTIDTPSIAGSIDLKGGRLDDVSLKHYHETTDPKSPIIELFSPSGAPHPYYADTGFVPAAGATTALPNRDTVWTADATSLTPEKPVMLTWDNGQDSCSIARSRSTTSICSLSRTASTTPARLRSRSFPTR